LGEANGIFSAKTTMEALSSITAHCVV
jgi:hypothetical protein